MASGSQSGNNSLAQASKDSEVVKTFEHLSLADRANEEKSSSSSSSSSSNSSRRRKRFRRLKPSFLGSYFTFDCERFLVLSIANALVLAHPSNSKSTVSESECKSKQKDHGKQKRSVSLLQRAHFTKGNVFEDVLIAHLRACGDAVVDCTGDEDSAFRLFQTHTDTTAGGSPKLPFQMHTDTTTGGSPKPPYWLYQPKFRVHSSFYPPKWKEMRLEMSFFFPVRLLSPVPVPDTSSGRPVAIAVAAVRLV